MKTFITKIAMIFALGFTILSANEIQVFTSNTMHIAIDKDAKVTPLYFGPANEFYKNRKDYLAKLNAKTEKTAATYGLMSLTNVAQGIGTGSNADLKGGAIGLASIAVISLSKATYDAITADKEYLFLSKVINSAGKETYIYTLIVANDSITKEEASKIAIKEIQNIQEV